MSMLMSSAKGKLIPFHLTGLPSISKSTLRMVLRPLQVGCTPSPLPNLKHYGPSLKNTSILDSSVHPTPLMELRYFLFARRMAVYVFASTTVVVGESVPSRLDVLGRPVMANKVSKEVKNTWRTRRTRRREEMKMRPKVFVRSEKDSERSPRVHALVKWMMWSCVIRIRMHEKWRKRRKEGKDRVWWGMMQGYTRWRGHNVNGFVDPNRSERRNGHWYPVTVETKNLA